MFGDSWSEERKASEAWDGVVSGLVTSSVFMGSGELVRASQSCRPIYGSLSLSLMSCFSPVGGRRRAGVCSECVQRSVPRIL